MSDLMMKAAGLYKDVSGVGRAKAIQVDSSGRVLTSKQLTEFIFVDGEEIRDTSRRTTADFEVGSSVYVAINRLDAPVRVAPRIERNYAIYYESGEFKSTSNIYVIVPPHGTQRIILNDALPRVLNRPLSDLSFSYNALETPTSGYFTLKAWEY